MTPLSAVFSATPRRLLVLASIVIAMTACANEPTAATSTAGNSPKPVCSAPPPVQDIWKLEPLLIDQGLISAEMTREQREAAIRDYIRKKNQAFLHCKEKK